MTRVARDEPPWWLSDNKRWEAFDLLHVSCFYFAFSLVPVLLAFLSVPRSLVQYKGQISAAGEGEASTSNKMWPHAAVTNVIITKHRGSEGRRPACCSSGETSSLTN